MKIIQTKKHASSFRVLVLIGVTAAFRAAFLPRSKLAETNHPVACPPQWLPVLLAANTPVPPTRHQRRLLDSTFTTRAELKTAVGEYNADKTAAEAKYGLISDWVVSGITDMSELFQGLEFINEDISSWDTSGVTNMERMFAVRALAQPPGPSLHAAITAAAHRPHPTHRSV